MADVVYILGGGAKAIDDRPLRWSLRSLAKYATNVGRVIVVGQIPKWLSDKALVVPTRVTTLPGDDAVKSWNIMYGYAMAVLRLGLDRPFLYSSDDHYFSAPADLDCWPRFFHGDLLACAPQNDWWHRCLADTGRLLAGHGLGTRRVCLHLNTWTDPRDVVSALAFAERYAQRLPYGVEGTCVYNAFYERRAGDGDFVDYPYDRKCYTAADCQAKVDKARPQFSTSPLAERDPGVVRWMDRHFPDPSPWERS